MLSPEGRGWRAPERPTMRDVHKIVAYFAPWQKLGSVVRKRVGDETLQHIWPMPDLPRLGKVDRTVGQQMDAQRQAGENPKMERRSTEFSHVRLIMIHTVAG